ncbi:hypothetical protein HS088_TW13G00243 [Tripterygium wilfordii]|uniref:Mic1 domain-containing protein n=1 Tax=Tripterygium wilfordii TaxID=458696 RepID=A0A7J7CTJ7_TRIWF|nr:hypothetical protein HS088_TW13G00243 [Tripterygium wilfordii]
MKEKNATPALRGVLVNCATQAKEYGSCVAAKVPVVERDMCLKEFLAMKNCMQDMQSIDLAKRYRFGERKLGKLLAIVASRSWKVFLDFFGLIALYRDCKDQLSAAGIIHLPQKFEMVMAKSESNSKPVLAAEDVYIAMIYGRIYCMQIDRVAMLLRSYRFYCDAVVQQGSFPIYSSKIAVSVVDNVLLIHQVDAKVVILYDVKQLCFEIVRCVILERRPMSMVAKAIDVLVSSYSYSIKTGCHLKGVKVEKPSPSDKAHISSPRTGTNISTGGVGEIGKSLKHECSAGLGNDLDRPLNFSVSDSKDGDSIDLPKAVKEYSSGADGSCVDVPPFSAQSQQLGMDNNSLNASVSEQLESQVTSPAISPDEMYSFIFAPVEEEMVGGSSYLVTIIVEFLGSANVEKSRVDPHAYMSLIRLLARNERYAELTLFVVNKIIEPSKEVAMQLLESGRQNFQTRKLVVDMLRQLYLHHDYVLQLVQDGYYLEALRYAQKFKLWLQMIPNILLQL